MIIDHLISFPSNKTFFRNIKKIRRERRVKRRSCTSTQMIQRVTNLLRRVRNLGDEERTNIQRICPVSVRFDPVSVR